MAVLEELLSPISDDRPGGEDVFYGERFANLIALRERRDSTKDRARAPDWEGVADSAKEILEQESKDVRVALYMAEALLHTEGFSGFHAGLETVVEILVRFPETAHPVEAEDRAYALDFLVGTLQADTRQTPEVIRAVELFRLTDWGHHFHDYQVWRRLEDQGSAADGDEPKPANFGKGLVSTGKTYYKELKADIPKCIAVLKSLQEWGEEYFADKVEARATPIPRYSRLIGELERVQRAVSDLLERKLVDDPDPVAETAEAAPADDDAADGKEAEARTSTATAANRGLSVEPQSVDDAVARVTSAARFLRRRAPTDPTPYMMIRGLRWGELRAAGSLDLRLLEPPTTELRRTLKGLLLDENWEDLLDAGEDVMGLACGRGWLDLQRYIMTALDNRGPAYVPVSSAIQKQLSALLADLPALLDASLMDDMPTANAETRAWLEMTGLYGDGAEPASDEPPDYDQERVLSEATHERALALAASGNARRGVGLLMKRADREESARAKFITESLAASVMVDHGMRNVARPLLEDIERLIESRKLAEWECAEIVARPLALLFRCLQPNDRKRTDLYEKICRLDPVHAMTLEHGDASGSDATKGQPFQASEPAPSGRGQQVQPNEPKTSQGEAVDSGSAD